MLLLTLSAQRRVGLHAQAPLTDLFLALFAQTHLVRGGIDLVQRPINLLQQLGLLTVPL